MAERALTVEELRACCAASAWVTAMVNGQPFVSADALLAASDAASAELDDAGLSEALAGHPRIGDRPSSGGVEVNWSRQEQAGMQTADSALRADMADANRRYEQRFGQMYLVCASGLSAAELHANCLRRLTHDPATERAVTLGELAKIVRLRLGRLLDEGPRR